ncbi:protein kinase [Nocardia sp. NPDC051570]|uniref:serine/threonine-protein kinase n=1 Tax=Nocardia sp. NPDC051570 TaxID=3364324 RepID=UPI00379A87F0
MDAPRSRVGSRFGPYELRSLLGRGGMGEVYEAYDSSRDRLVALKLLPEQLAQDPSYQERFRRESRAVAGLTERHIVTIHDSGEIDGMLYIDMKLVRGRNLRALLRDEGPMAPERAVSILAQVASALDAAHAAGLVHRDVKPANILVTDTDFAYLADFGLARNEGDTGITMVGTAVGSYTYMAPERFDDGPVTGRADIYSLACVLHECLTGATPFPSQSVSVLVRSHLSEPPPRPSLQRADVPEALDAALAHAMAKSPGDRFATAGEFAAAAGAALGMSANPEPAPADSSPGGEDTRLFLFGEPLAADPAVPGAGAGTRPVRSLLGSPPPPAPLPDNAAQSATPSGPAPDPAATTYLPTGPAPARLPAEPTTFQPFGPEGPTIPAQMRPRGPAAPAEPTRVQSDQAPAAQGYPLDEDSEQPTAGQRPEPPPPAAGSPTMVMRTGAGTGQPSTADSATTFLRREDLPGANQAGTDQAGAQRNPAESIARGYETTGTLRIIPPTGPDAEHDPTGDLPVIHPADPTLVRPGEFAFTPLPPHAQARPVAPWELPPSHDFPPRENHAYGREDDAYGEEYYDESDYDPDGYAESDRREHKRSIAVPMVLGVGGVALAAIAGAVGWHVMNKPDNTGTVVATGQATSSIAQPRTTATAATTPPAPTTTAGGTVTLPVGASACPATSATGRFAKSATGSDVTTCGFAEAVRKAYAKALEPQTATEAAGSNGPASVVAVSPATGRSYTMNCTATGQLVTCSGGENAVVYVY